MKFIVERGDLVLYPAATDGQGNDIYQYGMVEAVMGNIVYVGGGITMPMERVLPSNEDVTAVLNKVKKAHVSGAQVFGYKEAYKGCA